MKLGEIVGIISGFAFDSKLFNEEGNGMPIVRIRNVGKTQSNTYYSGDYKDEYLLEDGDYLIGMDGDFRLAEWIGGKALLNQRVCKIIPNKKKLNKSYLYYFLPRELKRIEDKTSFATVKHLSVKKINEIEIPLPPIETQKKIATILDKADELRRNDQKILEKYDQLAQSVFLEMFGDPVTNPKGWVKTKFDQVGSIERGVSKNRPRNAPELLSGKHPLIQTGDVANCKLYIQEYYSTYSDIGLAQSKKWPKETLCITIAANIAKTGILSFEACFPDSVVGFLPNEKTNVIYIHFWLSFLQKILESTAPESAQKNINLRILRELELPLPPIIEQNRFAEIIKHIETQKQLACQSLQKSEELFQSLLQRTFRGELGIETKRN